MKTKIIAAFILSILMLGLITPFTVTQVNADTTFNVYIRPDGSITDSGGTPISPPIITSDQTTYTLTGSFTGSITIQKSNLVLDGGGFTVTGSSSEDGVTVNSVNDVTVENLALSNFDVGIYAYQASNINITANTLQDGHDGIELLGGTSDSTVADNQISNSYFGGITVDGYPEIASDNNVVNNTVTNGDYGIKFSNGATLNNATGNQITSGEYGFILDVAGASNLVSYNTISGASQAGFYADYCSDSSTIANNSISDNTVGIQLWAVTNFVVCGNTISSNSLSMALDYSCGDQLIYQNNFINNQLPQLVDPLENTWDYNGQGNYWSDAYLSQNPGATQIGTSGIWDIPFVIDATGPNVDNYPLVHPFNMFTLTISTTGSGTTNPVAGQQFEQGGASVEITATADAGGEFYNWILNGQNVTANPITVTLSSDITLQSAFKQIQYTLTIEAATNGAVYSKSSDVDGTTHILNKGTYYSIRASPADGYEFEYWLVDGSQYSTSSDIKIPLYQDYDLQAVFAPIPLFVIPTNDTNWSMYMNDAGHSGQTNSLAPTTNQKLWSYGTGNAIDSSPAVFNGLIYVGSNDDNFYALNASTGQPAWSFQTDDRVESSPAVANGIVYFGSDDGNVYAVNADSGQLLWSFQTGRAVDYSPTIANGVVYVGSDNGETYALNALSGQEIWEAATDESCYSAPTVTDGVVYVGSLDYCVYALSVDTGNQIWSFPTDMGGWNGAATPVAVNGVVYIGSSGGYIYAINAQDGQKIWSYQTGDCIDTSPAVVNGVVYVGSCDGNVYALNALDGSQVWPDFSTDDCVESSPAVANGIIYIGSDDGNLYAINATNGQQVWNYQADDCLYQCSPAIADGVVYVASSDCRVYAFGTPSSVTFTSSGLASGTSWNVTVNGLTKTSTTNTITFACIDGTYTFTIGAQAGYTLSASSGSITVSGADASQPVTFAQNQYTLTVNSAHGNPTSSEQVNNDDSFTASVTSPESAGDSHQWICTGYSIDDGPAVEGTSHTFTNVDADHSITFYWQDQYYLTINNGEHGTATGQGWYEAGTEVQATLSSATVQGAEGTRYVFAGWSGDTSGSNSVSDAFVMNSAKTATAIWITEYLVSYIVNPAHAGIIITPTDSSVWVSAGSIDISATSNANYTFDSWSETGLITIASAAYSATTAVISGPCTITANFDSTNIIIATKTTDSKTYAIALNGNITAQQMTNLTITPFQSNSTTAVDFAVTGTSGTEGFGNITLPIIAISYGTTPTVYIDGQPAECQGYTQDADNYYVWYTTHFSTHQIELVFITSELPSQTPETPATPSASSTPTNTPTPTTIPTPNSTASPSSTPNPTPLHNSTSRTALAMWDQYLAVVLASLLLVVLIVGIIGRRRKQINLPPC